jgi:LPS-assembly lipoprotein
MSLREVSRAGRLGLVLGAVALIAAAGCTVRPLYSSATDPVTGQRVQTAGLNSINIPPIQTRYGQELRNQLIFLLNGGAGQPASAKYTMALNASMYVQDQLVVSVGSDSRPTAATLTMTGTYVLTEIATGKTVASGSRSISSSFDKPIQQFAVVRAQRDAEDRAARELAEILRLDVGQRLARISG